MILGGAEAKPQRNLLQSVQKQLHSNSAEFKGQHILGEMNIIGQKEEIAAKSTN